MSDALKDQILEQVGILPLEERQRVLDFARALAASGPSGVPGKDLLRFAGMFDADDPRRMAEAIEDSCERVDPDEW
ncbi:MAG: hypothetical protein M3259_10735 [Actinomycetota bacterium]|nr:hypothetical protein [Actinomycetota bacterium]